MLIEMLQEFALAGLAAVYQNATSDDGLHGSHRITYKHASLKQQREVVSFIVRNYFFESLFVCLSDENFKIFIRLPLQPVSRSRSEFAGRGWVVKIQSHFVYGGNLSSKPVFGSEKIVFDSFLSLVVEE